MRVFIVLSILIVAVTGQFMYGGLGGRVAAAPRMVSPYGAFGGQVAAAPRMVSPYGMMGASPVRMAVPARAMAAPARFMAAPTRTMAAPVRTAAPGAPAPAAPVRVMAAPAPAAPKPVPAAPAPAAPNPVPAPKAPEPEPVDPNERLSAFFDWRAMQNDVDTYEIDYLRAIPGIFDDDADFHDLQSLNRDRQTAAMKLYAANEIDDSGLQKAQNKVFKAGVGLYDFLTDKAQDDLASIAALRSIGYDVSTYAVDPEADFAAAESARYNHMADQQDYQSVLLGYIAPDTNPRFFDYATLMSNQYSLQASEYDADVAYDAYLADPTPDNYLAYELAEDTVEVNDIRRNLALMTNIDDDLALIMELQAARLEADVAYENTEMAVRGYMDAYGVHPEEDEFRYLPMVYEQNYGGGFSF